MRTSVLLAAGLLAVAGIGGGALVKSSRFTLPASSPSAARSAASATGAATRARPRGSGADDNANVVRSKARVRPVELPYYVVHDTGDDFLLSERHATLNVQGSASSWRMARTALTALEEAPRAEGDYLSPLPPGTRILGVRIDLGTGIATVDMSPEFRGNFNGGARSEQMAVYAVVNTVGSVPGVRGVVFQIAGRPLQELGGHLDLSEPLVPDHSIVETAS